MVLESIPAAAIAALNSSSDEGHQCSMHTSSICAHSCVQDNRWPASRHVTSAIPTANGNVEVVLVLVVALVVVGGDEVLVTVVVVVAVVVLVVRVTGTLERHGQNRRVLDELLPSHLLSSPVPFQ